MTSCLKANILLRDNQKRKAMVTKLETDWMSYKRMRNDITLQIRKAKNEYYSNKSS